MAARQSTDRLEQDHQYWDGPIQSGITHGAALAALTPGLNIMGGVGAVIGGSAGLAGVAAGAIGGAVGSLGFAEKTFSNAVVAGAVSSAVTQGVGVAMGWQEEFSWAGVAAAGVSAGVGKIVGDKLKLQSFQTDRSIGNIAEHGAVGAARAIANTATRSLIEGTEFENNLRAAAPDIIGQTIGDMIVGGIARAQENARLARTAEHLRRLPAFAGQHPSVVEAAASIFDQIGGQRGDYR